MPVGPNVIATTLSKLQDYLSAKVYESHPLTHNFWNMIWVCILSIVTAISNCRWLSVLPFPCRHSVCATVTSNMADTAGSVNQCLWLQEHCHRCTCCRTLLTRADSQQPLYVLSPSNGAPATCIFGCPTTMYRAAKNTSGSGSIRGAQHIQGLLRIYPCRQEARNKLLLEGMHLWRVQVSLLPIKPVHLTRPKQGETSYKTVGGKFPTWSGDHVIKTALKKRGCEMWSMVRKELAHDKNGKMTNWEMGRRFISTQSMIWKGNGEKIYSVYKEQIEITI